MTPGNDSSSAPNAAGNTVFLFDTTHAAMEAERLIIDGGIWCDVVPRPPGTMSSLCGLAIETLSADLDDVKNLLAAGGIAYEIFKPEVEAQ